MSYTAGHVPPCFYFVRWGKPELDDLKAVQREVSRLSDQVGELIYVAIVPTDAEPPTSPVRKAMMDSMGDVLEHCRSMHFVVEGSGFKHSAARSALAGILLVSGRRGKCFVHRTVDEAVAAVRATISFDKIGVLSAADAQGLLSRGHPAPRPVRG